MLEGRGADLSPLCALVDRARAGRGGTCWIEGDAGVGKTTLLDALVEGLPSDVDLVRMTGREAESGLAWGALAPLLTRLVAGGHADALPDGQRAAIRTALALDVAPSPLEPYAVVTGTHAMLTRAAEERTIVLVVDDAHWLDESSLLAVSYLVARQRDGRIAVVVAGRPEPTRRPPVHPTVLEGIDDSSADALLVDRGVTDPTIRRRIVEGVGGNPLLLVATADALDEGQRTGHAPLPEILPVPASVMGLAEARLQALPAASRTALLVAAAAGGAIAALAAARPDLDVSVADIEPAERAGVVTIVDDEIHFAHPTLRSAAYHSAEAPDRRAAHRAVARASADPTTRAWHRGQGTLGIDDEAADALDASAQTLIRRGAPLEAARHLELAARLTRRDVLSAARLRRAAEILSEHGRDESAGALLDRADRIAGDPGESLRRRRIRLRMALRSGSLDEPMVELRALADEVLHHDPGLSAEILLDLAAPLVRMIRAEDLRLVAEAARERASAVGDERMARRAEVAIGIGTVAAGDPAGYDRFQRYREVLESEGALRAGVFLADVVAPCLAYLQRTEERRALFETLERDLRAASAIPVLVSVLGAQAIALAGTSLPQATAVADEAVELAEAIGRPSIALVARSSLAMAAAAIGDRERSAAAATGLLDSGEPAVRQTGLAAQAFLHLGHGELDDALAVYERLAAEIGMGKALLRWEGDWCETFIRARRPADAARTLAAAVAANQALLSGGAFGRVRVLLAEDLSEAEGHYRSTIAWYQLVGNRVGEGRTELVWGERLRRGRRRRSAQEHLERARDLLDDVGAVVWAARARHELEAVSAARGTGAQGIDALTGRELAIARQAASGASNREIGELVFLSPRTIEAHLSAIYRKLGIANRRQLAALALEEPRLRP